MENERLSVSLCICFLLNKKHRKVEERYKTIHKRTNAKKGLRSIRQQG